MATLHADYGYDFFELEITEDEVRQIKEKRTFPKLDQYGVKPKVAWSMQIGLLTSITTSIGCIVKMEHHSTSTIFQSMMIN